MKVILGSLVFLLVGCLLSSGEPEAADMKVEDKQTIDFTELGVVLYGKFIYEAEGELVTVENTDGLVLVEAGAVLSCIRNHYTIGYYPGEVTYVTKSGEERKIPKVYFILDPKGEIKFYLPSSKDKNFFGEQITKPISFGPLDHLGK